LIKEKQVKIILWKTSQNTQEKTYIRYEYTFKYELKNEGKEMKEIHLHSGAEDVLPLVVTHRHPNKANSWHVFFTIISSTEFPFGVLAGVSKGTFIHSVQRNIFYPCRRYFLYSFPVGLAYPAKLYQASDRWALSTGIGWLDEEEVCIPAERKVTPSLGLAPHERLEARDESRNGITAAGNPYSISLEDTAASRTGVALR